jgi:hypothetical protein
VPSVWKHSELIGMKKEPWAWALVANNLEDEDGHCDRLIFPDFADADMALAEEIANWKEYGDPGDPEPKLVPLYPDEQSTQQG